MMSNISIRRQLRYLFLALCDAFVCALSLVCAMALRFNGYVPGDRLAGLLSALPIFVGVSIATFAAARLYERTWRYFSAADLLSLLKVVTVSLIVALATLMWMGLDRWMPMSVPILYLLIATISLSGLRCARRAFRERTQTRRRDDAEASKGHRRVDIRRRALLLGEIDWAESVLGAVARMQVHSLNIVGLLDHCGLDVRLRVHGLRVLGTIETLDDVVGRLAGNGRRPEVLIVNASDPLLKGPAMVSLVGRAERLGLEVAKVAESKLVQRAEGQFDLEFLNVADLLGRPQVSTDTAAVAAAVTGRRIMVTGAGGTIGSELVRQLARFRPAEIQLVDCGEYNLYAIDLELGESFPELNRKAILCSIRQRQSVFRIFEEHRPELVFHAAALKHVPLVEQNPCSGVQTNVMGTRNVADAVRKFGALAMIQVSTDKAVNPIGLMGATKRLGEVYCQAMDLAGSLVPDSPRFMTVRFGNVLGSSGSLVPLLQRQLSRGGPLTVTHPKIERFFMTVHEAVQLILHGSAQALNAGSDRGKIFVLDMGSPIKILELARRMIRLAGLKPDVDVKIDFIGLRPGEKLYEELFDSTESRLPSSIVGILRAEAVALPLSLLETKFEQISRAASSGDADRARALVFDLVDRSRNPVRAAPAAARKSRRASPTPPVAVPVPAESWASSPC